MKVVVLMGGTSAEREISLETGKAILQGLRNIGYETFEIDVGSDLPLRLAEIRPDVAFIALHGRLGEDGAVQGLLEVMRIPYTGSGVLSSALCMDKVFTKKILTYHNLPIVSDVVARKEDDSEEVISKVEKVLSFPVMVKPSKEGSSIAVSRADSPDELEIAIKSVFAYDEVVIIEKYIEGKLLTVGLIGKEPIILPVLEIKPKEGFYDYRNKYEPGRTEYEVPAKIEKEKFSLAQELSYKAFNALDCKDIARVDLMLEISTGNIYILEVNTIPGMTTTSLIPKAAKAIGFSFEDVIRIVLQSAQLKIRSGE